MSWESPCYFFIFLLHMPYSYGQQYDCMSSCMCSIIFTSTAAPAPSLMDPADHIFHLCPPTPFYVSMHNHLSSVFHLLIPTMLPHFLCRCIHPFISMSMCEVTWTHLMGLCVSRKWLAQVSRWPCRRATRCCPRLPWCQRKYHVSWEELLDKGGKNIFGWKDLKHA